MAQLKKQIRTSVVGQFHRPHGLGGRAVGWIMGTRSSNVGRNRWAVDLLDVQSTDRVLEIGFGPGVAIEAFAARATDGTVYGFDHSELMVRQATRRNRRAVAEGRVQLAIGSVDAVPDLGPPLDIVFTVNTVMFWPDPPTQLADMAGRLRPGGTLALVHQPRHQGADAAAADRWADDLSGLLRAAGLDEVRVDRLDLDPPVVAVRARAQRVAT
jgi:trans-aconitate methyltransferase